MLQAVDGVGLKHAVNAWASAENGDKAVRFAAAETVRWLEWAVRSYQSFVFGLALILFGAVIAVTGRVSRPIGYLMALSGLSYLAQGWNIGSSGFYPDHTGEARLRDQRVDPRRQALNAHAASTIRRVGLGHRCQSSPAATRSVIRPHRSNGDYASRLLGQPIP